MQSTKKEKIKQEIKNEFKIKQEPAPKVKLEPTDDLGIEHEDFFPISPAPNTKSNKVAYVVIDRNEMNTAYQDLTGRFPILSARGNEYIMIGYHFDANYIMAHPVRDCTAGTLTKAWEHMHKEFQRAGSAPETWVLNNEKSNEFKSAFNKYDVQYQLVPPRSHRRNLAERAIQTWKNHFKAGLVIADPKFPLTEWDRLIPQANITLNLLRTARTNPNLSAYAYIYGNFDFSATPLAPPGTKLVAHIDPTEKGT